MSKKLSFEKNEKTESFVRFNVLTVASVKLRVFWDVAPCSQVDFDRPFRGAYCLYHQDRPDDGGNMHL
jgi:hypothetical protein